MDDIKKEKFKEAWRCPYCKNYASVNTAIKEVLVQCRCGYPMEKGYMMKDEFVVEVKEKDGPKT